MSRKHVVFGLITAIIVTAQGTAGQEEVLAERLAEVEQALTKVQQLMGELLRDQSTAERVVERTREDVREAFSEEQVERMKELVHTYRRRLEQNTHWLERLQGHEERLRELQRRLHAELGPVRERLREMDIEERMAHIEEIAHAITAAFREGPHEEDEEREHVIAQIETLHMALGALREEGRHDAIEAVERAIHAREMALEGRTDREARMIRERAPHREHIVEILVLAEEIYREYGDHEHAEKLTRLTERLWGEREEPRRRREREREPRRHEEQQWRDVQTMEQAIHALREAERTDAADLMRRALEARIVDLERVRGREADRVRERAPDLPQTVELLRFAAELWEEYGYEERAAVPRELAERMWEGRERPREPRERRRRGRAEEPERREAIIHRIEMLQERLAEMREMIEIMQEELQELKHLAR
jgi:hypothetical protein